MYIPPAFEVTGHEELLAFVDAVGFAQLVSVVEGQPFVTHLPLLLSPDNNRLIGHVARANPHWRALDDPLDAPAVLAVFSGPHGYISPSWYEAPGVPTWNYQTVHVTGRCQVFDDEARLAGVVEALTARHEREQSTPWQPDYGAVMLRAIIGLEIRIETVVGKFKLGQNRSPADRAGVVAALEAGGNAALAAAMRSVDARAE